MISHKNSVKRSAMRIFVTMSLCVAITSAQLEDFSMFEHDHTPDDCKLPKRPGHCRALLPAYYYDKATKKCMAFNYGGCQGNANNFETMEECRSVCETKVQLEKASSQSKHSDSKDGTFDPRQKH